MNTSKKPPLSGFTLIELLTVVAIIGILAAILVPTASLVINKAAQASSSASLKEIALSYGTYSLSGTRERTITDGSWSETSNRSASNMKEWAKVLAYHVELSDARIWIIGRDEAVSNYDGVIPRSIGIREGKSYTEFAEWTALDPEVIGYTAAVNMSTRAPASSTPLIWTKGLGSDGVWSSTSPWEGNGGHIAYMDGHVEFIPNLVEDEFKVTPGSASGVKEMTSDIEVATKTTSSSRVLN